MILQRFLILWGVNLLCKANWFHHSSNRIIRWSCWIRVFFASIRIKNDKFRASSDAFIHRKAKELCRKHEWLEWLFLFFCVTPQTFHFFLRIFINHDELMCVEPASVKSQLNYLFTESTILIGLNNGAYVCAFRFDLPMINNFQCFRCRFQWIFMSFMRKTPQIFFVS